MNGEYNKKMKKFYSALWLILFCLSPLYSSDKQNILESYGLRPSDAVIEIPAPAYPLNEFPGAGYNPGFTYTQKAQYGGSGFSGVPDCFFTEETKVSEVISGVLDNTNYTLDVALYNLQIPVLSQKILDARDRGVKVRVIIDYDHVYPEIGKEIKFLIDNGVDLKLIKGIGGSGSMHNKYAVFDGAALQTGSANWSLSAENASFENMMFVYDKDIIEGFQKNFEWLWTYASPANARYEKPAMLAPAPADPGPSVELNGEIFPKYIFSPNGGTQDMIVKAIDSAMTEVDAAMFTFTSEPIFNALKRASARGINVKLMVHAGQKFPFMADALRSGLGLKLAKGRVEKGLMHNKYVVIDNKFLANGSFNWTKTAEIYNFENTIFTVNPVYVAPYKAEFEKLYSKAYRPKKIMSIDGRIN